MIKVFLAMIFLTSGCSRDPHKRESLEGNSFDFPRTWTGYGMEDNERFYASPDWDSTKQFGAFLRVSIEDPDEIGDLKSELSLARIRSKIPGFQLDGPSTFSLSGRTASAFTVTRTKVEHLGMHRSPDRPEAKPLLWKETKVFAHDANGKQYWIHYEAPAELYDRHKPHFDHLLSTWKWKGG